MVPEWSQRRRREGVEDSIGYTGEYVKIALKLDELLFSMKKTVLDFRIQDYISQGSLKGQDSETERSNHVCLTLRS